MRTLLVLRHAKSSWDDRSVRDFDRTLDARGRRDAPRMGRALATRGPAPDLVLCSPAARARETAGLLLPAAGLMLAPRFDDALYGATCAELAAFVRRLPSEASCVLLVGHNPGFEELVARLAGTGPTEMPTAALACLESDAPNWADLDGGRARLAWLLRPRDL